MTGVVPLGAFLVVHLALNARALGGASAFAATVRALHDLPALPLVESLFVFAPFVFHGGLGVWLVATRRPLVPPAPYPPVLRSLMRATGVVAIAFLAMHLPELRFQSAGTRLGGDELATLLDADLSRTSRGVPWYGLAYLTGTACVTFHFACGLWGFFAITHAGRESASRRRWAALGAIAGGLAIWVAFADIVVLHATGAELVRGGASQPVAPEACPQSDR